MYKTVKKAVNLIEILAESEAPRRVSELGRALGWPKSNVHQMLDTLVQLGIARQEEEDSGYNLTLRIWELGMLVQSRLSPRKVALRHMRSLADETGETVHLSVFDTDHVVYIDHIESTHPVRSHSRLGGRGPAYCTATGKAMLAFQSPKTIRAVLEKLEPFTEATITAPERIVAELEQVRLKGYAIQQEEWVSGVTGIGAPIFDSSGQVVAGLGISGPAARLTSDFCDQIGLRVREFARLSSIQLGYSNQEFPPHNGNGDVREPLLGPTDARSDESIRVR